jgi:uncharacterized protein (DUF433 family)
MTYERIAVDPGVMAGMPTIRGLRIPVATVIAMLADGMSPDEIVLDLPDLSISDVHDCLRFAAQTTRERHVPVLAAA